MAHVLLLEPDPVAAGLYTQALRLRGHTVTAVATAQDAVLEADGTKPDIVLLELQLTAHSGIEFLYEFRSYVDWQTVPIVVSSHVPPAEFKLSQRLLERLGVVAYYYKPRTSLQTLLLAIEKALTPAVPL